MPSDAFTNMDSGRSRQLLLVDDEESILQSLRRMLRRDGYVIHLANSGEAGLEILEREPIGVIVTDQRMPGMTGSEFLGKVKERFPDTMRIVLSGYTELNSIADAINRGAIYKFLTKPWDDDLLRQHIAEAFERHEMKDENRRLAELNRAMIDAVPDALFLVDGESRLIAFANQAAARLIHVQEGALVGRHIADFEPLPLDQCYWEELSGGQFRPLVDAETEYQRADGEFVPVRKTTVLMSEGDKRTVLILAHDLSQQRQLEFSLERANAEMAAIFEATTEGMLILDAQHRLVRVNQRFAVIWNLSRALLEAGDGDAILSAMAEQSKTPAEIRSELTAHFVAPEARSSGFIERSSGDRVCWSGNPLILNDELIGHVFGFSLEVPPEVW